MNGIKYSEIDPVQALRELKIRKIQNPPQNDEEKLEYKRENARLYKLCTKKVAYRRGPYKMASNIE